LANGSIILVIVEGTLGASIVAMEIWRYAQLNARHEDLESLPSTSGGLALMKATEVSYYYFFYDPATIC
jgi:hypothetical protein